MSRAYKFKDQTKPYFVTFTVVNWIDLFIRKEYCYILLDSMEYCQKEKGLIIYAWVIMSIHVHMIGNKLNYIHNNPVDAGIVINAEDYVFSSAIDYTGQKGLLNVELLL